MSKQGNLAFLNEQSEQLENCFSQTRVVGVIGDWFLFEGRNLSGRAKLSADCFLKPGIGDEVLLFKGESQTFVLNVLARASMTEGAKIIFPNDSQLMCERGKLSIKADSLALQTKEAIELEGNALSLSANNMELRTQSFKGWCTDVDIKTFSIRIAANQLLSVCGRVMQHAKECFRWIEHTDQTRANRIRLHAKDHVQVTSTHASIRAQGFVKIDGQKIDLG
jgi:hypothetical protein